MANVVYITTGMGGALNASFELSRRLEVSGHSVSYLSPRDVEAAVMAHGHSFRQLVADRDPDVDFATSLDLPEISDVVASLNPDVLLIDIEMHYAVIATSSLAVPTVIVSPWFSVFRDPTFPPLSSALLPPLSLGDRLAVWWSWAVVRAGAWRRRTKERLRLARRDSAAPVRYDTVDFAELRALARSRGFDFAEEVDWHQWLRPYVYRRLPILALVPQSLEFPQRRVANLTYAGPMVLRDRNDGDEGQRAEIESWLSGREPDRPLVFCSLGSYWAADLDLLGRIVEVFRGRSDWDLVIGLGGTADPGALGQLPKNVRVFAWAPQVLILSHSDAAITHGGIGTINECLVLGVPMVVYSTGFVDQDGCAARVVHGGVGVMGDPANDRPADIENLLEDVLGDPSFREAVMRHRQIEGDPAVASRAVALLESVIDSGSDGPS